MLLQQKSNCSKFGVIYGKDGQDETQMYNNGPLLFIAFTPEAGLALMPALRARQRGIRGFPESTGRSNLLEGMGEVPRRLLQQK